MDAPMFDIQSANPNLLKVLRPLRTAQMLKEQMGHLLAFVQACSMPKAPHVVAVIGSLEGFDPQRYSLKQLIDLNAGDLIVDLEEEVLDLKTHVVECPVRTRSPKKSWRETDYGVQHCQAKGYICEMCKNSTPFFSYEMEIAQQCPGCRSFFHRTCYSGEQRCPKCARIRMREERKQQNA